MARVIFIQLYKQLKNVDAEKRVIKKPMIKTNN